MLNRKRKPKNNTTPKEPRKKQKQNSSYNTKIDHRKLAGHQQYDHKNSLMSSVKLEVKLPSTAEQMVMNMQKHGMDVMARLKSSDTSHYDDTKLGATSQVSSSDQYPGQYITAGAGVVRYDHLHHHLLLNTLL